MSKRLRDLPRTNTGICVVALVDVHRDGAAGYSQRLALGQKQPWALASSHGSFVPLPNNSDIAASRSALRTFYHFHIALVFILRQAVHQHLVPQRNICCLASPTCWSLDVRETI